MEEILSGLQDASLSGFVYDTSKNWSYMKWTFSIENKLKASLTLLLLCIVVAFSNYRVKKLSVKVIDSVQTIYDDRLVVQDLIYSYNKILDYHEHIPIVGLSNAQKDSIKQEIAGLNTHYLKTVLTDEEAGIFNSFSQNLELLLSVDSINESALIQQMKNQLERLSQIQMEEASKEMSVIHKAKGSQEIGFYLETVALIVLLLILQAMVVRGNGIKKVIQKSNFSLN